MSAPGPSSSRQPFPPRPRAPLKASFVRRHPFVAYGLPFLGLMLASSVFLSQFSELKYKRNDRKVSWTSRDALVQEEMDRYSKPTPMFDIRKAYFDEAFEKPPEPKARHESSLHVDAYTGEKFELPAELPMKPVSQRPNFRRGNYREGDVGMFERQFNRDPEDWDVVRVPRPAGVAEWGQMEKTWDEKKAEREKKLV